MVRNIKPTGVPTHSHLRNIRASSIALLVTALFSLFCTPYILSNLGDTKFAIWAILNTVFGVSGLVDIGLRASFELRLTRAWHLNNLHYINVTFVTGKHLTSQISYFIAAATITSAAVIVLTNLVPTPLRYEVTLAVLTLGLQLCMTLKLFPYGALIVAMRRFDVVGNVAIFQVLATAIATVACVTFTSNLGLLAIAIATPSLLGLAIGRHIARKWFDCDVAETPSKKLRWIFLKTGFLRFAATASARVITQIDLLTVYVTCGLASVSPYTLGASLAVRLLDLAKIYERSLNGEIMLLNTQKKFDELKTLVTASVRYSALLMLPFTTISMLYASRFYTLWTPETSNALAAKPYNIYCLLALYGFTITTCLPLSKVIAAAEKHVPLAKACILEAVVNLGLSLLLGSVFGKMGVAGATVIACWLVHVPTRIFLSKQTIQIQWHRLASMSMCRPLICLAAYAPILYFSSVYITGHSWLSLVTAGAFCVVTWIPIAAMLGLTREECQFIKRKMRSMTRRDLDSFS